MLTILLCCYNGERYLSQQLDSLLGQTFRDFCIVIRNDGSVDRTPEILREYQRAYPAVIAVETARENSGGAQHSFWKLMASRRDDYLMLCDQDDIWLPDKIEKTLRRMRELERQFGAGVPLAVHTDLAVVDERLRPLAPSLWSWAEIHAEQTQLSFQLTHAVMTGCTVLYNRALAEYFTGRPRFMIMHDWWIMLAASAFGHVAALPEATVLYRQHGGNAVGARNVRSLQFRLRQLCHLGEVRRRMRETFWQAESFLALYRGRLSPEQEKLLAAFCSIPSQSKLERWRQARRLQLYPGGALRCAIRFLLI